jgi:hypothetical protein
MQVRVGQPLEWLFHTRGGLPHGSAPGLQFVWLPGRLRQGNNDVTG